MSKAATSEIASDYLDAIVLFCEGLAVFPIRVKPRDDIRAGLRTVAYRKRVVIAFFVDESAKAIEILGVFVSGIKSAKRVSVRESAGQVRGSPYAGCQR